jgi:hypothetical protein
MAKRRQFAIETKFGEVTAEIGAVIERTPIRDMDVLASRVLNNHPEVRGKDADFHLCCAFRAIRHEVRQQLNQRKFEGSAPQQGTFVTDGFEYLKAGYAVERDGHQLHLVLDQLTDRELLAKADEYDSMSDSLRKEASELRRYVSLRQVHQMQPQDSPGREGISAPSRP